MEWLADPENKKKRELTVDGNSIPLFESTGQYGAAVCSEREEGYTSMCKRFF
jgi:hypothetical protein